MKDYMLLALNEAKKAFQNNEVPIGCVIVKEDKIIAKAYNKKVKNNCAINHAEIECIKKASKKLNNWYLENCEMYVTLEPCMMCTGAIINSRIKTVYYGCKDPKGGALESNIKIKEIKNINHYPNIIQGNHEKESSEILKTFFKNKRLPR